MNSQRTAIIMGSLGFLILLLSTSSLPAQSAPQVTSQKSRQDASTADASRRAAWQIQLGARVAGLASQLPRLDVVVLVPDLATWIDEVRRWGSRGTWPVLIEDDRFTPIFLRKFAPRQLVRRASVGEDVPESAAARRALAREIQNSFWRPASEADDSLSTATIYRNLGWRPPGIVATDFGDPAWPAALVLAMLRGQLLVDLPGDFGAPNGSIDEPEFVSLDRTVTGFFESSGWNWKALGDDLDALTVCRSLPVRVRMPRSPEQLPMIPNLNVDRQRTPLALTDLLCRNADGSRYAVCGWIFGSEIRSIYMAMCSLFIDRDSIGLVDGYDGRRGGTMYAHSNTEEVLSALSYESGFQGQGEQTSRANWLPLMSGGVPSDVLFVNSSGQAGFMEMASGTRLQAADLPALKHPLALYLIHSFSLFAPQTPNSIGGRWLDRGVYAYVGSCNEPMLGAFRPASHIIRQISLFVPFIVAARLDEGEFSKPWRVVTIGDPLMLVEQPSLRRINTLEAMVEVDEVDVDVRPDLVRRLRAEEDVTPGMLRDLHLLGQDELATGLWTNLGDDATPEHARAFLPVLFERGVTGDYRKAFALAGEPAGEAREMLWTLHGGRCDNLRNPSDVSLFERNLRVDMMAQDLEALMPSIVRTRGQGSQRAAVVSAMNRDPGRTDMNGLTAMLEKYPR